MKGGGGGVFGKNTNNFFALLRSDEELLVDLRPPFVRVKLYCLRAFLSYQPAFIRVHRGRLRSLYWNINLVFWQQPWHELFSNFLIEQNQLRNHPIHLSNYNLLFQTLIFSYPNVLFLADCVCVSLRILSCSLYGSSFFISHHKYYRNRTDERSQN
jgi:hypothetical protein